MKYIAPRTTAIVPTSFSRPTDGPRWTDQTTVRDIPLSGQSAWQSNGGPHSGHPARSRPYRLEAEIPQEAGQLVRLYIVGVFGQWSEHEPAGTIGASIQLWDDEKCVHQHDLLNGRHYSDASQLDRSTVLLGDGSSIETVGTCMMGNSELRVDVLTFDVPAGVIADKVVFRDTDTPAGFSVFDIALEFQREHGCPFKAKTGGVSLGELGAIVRVGDRLRLNRALDQLDEAMSVAEHDLDEARSMALTFVAVICSAMLELGGSREIHHVTLTAARELETLATGPDIARAVRDWVEFCLADLMSQSHGLSSQLIDRALAIVDRHYAKDLSDAAVASKLGLSTSHFRALFKQATGQPFHRYVISMRLEKAKQMLMEMDLPVTDVASAVGFTGLSHFSRAFTQRFAVSPSNIRRLGR